MSFTGAIAQDETEYQGKDSIQRGPGALFVLQSEGQWGPAHDEAVLGAGGTVTFKHLATGIATVSAADGEAFKTSLGGNLSFKTVTQDFEVQWQPSEPFSVEDVQDEAVNPTNDTFINVLWNMTAIDAYGAWAAGYDGSGVRVAVIDGGICSAHPDLAANIDVAASRSFRAGFNYDQDTGGNNTFRHACHVAGIIAARDNTIGVVGVAPNATIIGLKALHGGTGPFSAVIAAILYASDKIEDGGAGADIINMSLGAAFSKDAAGAGDLVAAMNKAVNYAASKGVLVVCSAGNNNIDMDHAGPITHVPSQSGSAIGVSATAPVGFAVGWPNGATNFTDRASYSNYGRSVVWVSAPGGDGALPGNAFCAIPPTAVPCWAYDLVLSTGNQAGGYSWTGGTSMAAPHVAGVAALIKQRFPNINLGNLKTQLAQTADDAGAIGQDPVHGHGFLNAHRAVTESPSLTSPEETSARGALGVDLAVYQKRGDTPEISFSQRRAGMVRVDLFDLAGRNVATLYNGHAPAGRTVIAWSGRGSHGQDLARGSYYARVQSEGGKATRQVLLLGR